MKLLQSFLFGLRHPKLFLKWIRAFRAFAQGLEWSAQHRPAAATAAPTRYADNRLWEFFQNKKTGHGIWKWEHYFGVYDRHLRRFRGQNLSLLEIGIFSGGSLEMWRDYFGDGCAITGVDIEEACKVYEQKGIRVLIGDQESREFWASFRKTHPMVDVVIDDGGHEPNQQRVTFEEVFSHIKPGGVFICEDIHQLFNDYSFHAYAVAMNLNGMRKEAGFDGVVPNALQKEIKSVHFYPYMVVIEKADVHPERLVAPRHGTEWQPFL